MNHTKVIAFLFLVFCSSPHVAPAEYANGPSQTLPLGVFSVRDFGAKGDGTTLDTKSITKAIQAAHDAGGGTVLFPAGVYLTGTFELLSNVTLDLQAGAVIQGSKNLVDYGSTDAFGFGHNYGVDSTGEGPQIGIIIGRNVQNVAIVGRGAIDGNGDSFFDFDKPHYSMDFDPKYTRNGDAFMKAVLRTEDGPVQMKSEGRPGTMIICTNCRNVLIRDITLSNAPNWTVHFNNTEGAVVTGIHVWNNPLLPNNDGFDCFGCKDVHFSDCDIHAGDDDFAILNSTDITINNCSLTSRSSGIRVEATHYSTFQNLVIHANRGIGIYERGIGTTDHLLFSGITMETHLFTGHWWGKGEPIYIVTSKPAAGRESGQVHDVSFSNITGEAENSIVLYGSPEAHIRNVSFDNVKFKVRMTRGDVNESVGGNYDLRWTATDLSKAVFRHDVSGLYGRFVDDLTIRDLTIEWGTENPGYFSNAIHCEDFSRLDIDGFLGRQAPDSPEEAAISLNRGLEVSIRNSKAAPGTGIFLYAIGVQAGHLFVANDVTNAKQAFKGERTGFEFSGTYGFKGRKESVSNPH